MFIVGVWCVFQGLTGAVGIAGAEGPTVRLLFEGKYQILLISKLENAFKMYQNNNQSVFLSPSNNFGISHYLTFKSLKLIGQYTMCTIYCNMKLNDFGSKLPELDIFF